MADIPKLPDIPEEQRTALVTELLEVIRYQMEVIQALKDEIAVLKGNKPRPKIKPGKMEQGTSNDKKSSKAPGSIKKR